MTVGNVRIADGWCNFIGYKPSAGIAALSATSIDTTGSDGICREDLIASLVPTVSFSSPRSVRERRSILLLLLRIVSSKLTLRSIFLLKSYICIKIETSLLGCLSRCIHSLNIITCLNDFLGWEQHKLTPTTGTLVGEPLPFNAVESKNSLFRGQVQLADGSDYPCLLKNIDRIEVVNELVSNLIAYRLGLPTPKAVLTFVPDQFNDRNQFSKGYRTDGGVIVFSSVDVQTPNLAQRINSAHPMAQKIIIHALNTWTKKSILYGFDTWVANVDRHAGNLLFGSKNEVWLIDHGKCFTKEDWSPHDLEPDFQYTNRLKEWYTRCMDAAMLRATASQLPAVQGDIGALNISSILTDSLASGLTYSDEQEALRDFLTARVSRITTDASAALRP